MNKKSRVAMLIIVAVVAAVAAVKAVQYMGRKSVDTVQARSKGPVSAKVQIVEFIDFECPACAFGAQTLHDQMDKHPADIRLQVKYFPLVKPHRHAMAVALYSECTAQQGRFWEFHELLMPSQKQWSPLLSADAMFRGFAQQAGVNIGQLKECLVSDTAAKVIKDDRSLGQSLGVQSTPTYFINNKMVVGGKAMLDELAVYFPEPAKQ